MDHAPVIDLAIFLTVLCAFCGADALAEEAAILELSVVDASTRRAVHARIRLRDLPDTAGFLLLFAPMD